MTAERESMTLQEMDALALGVEERRDEAPGAGASHARPTPDPEVVAKPKRRKFTAQYRLRILEEAESCTQPGEVGRLLRREGLYSSHLTEWHSGTWPEFDKSGTFQFHNVINEPDFLLLYFVRHLVDGPIQEKWRRPTPFALLLPRI